MNINTGKLRTNLPTSQSNSNQIVPQSVQSYTVELPSKGKLYNGKSTVELTFFTLGDVKRIYDISQGIKSDSLEKLISSKVLDFDVFELCQSDYWYVLYWLRINCFTSHPLEIEWTCNHAGCGVKNLSKVGKENLNQVEINPDYIEPASLELPDSGTIQVRLPRVKDDREIDAVVDLLHGKLRSEGDEWLCKLAAMWVDNRNLMDRYKDVRSKFTPDDIFVLDSFQKEYSFGITEYLDVKCIGCQEVSRRYFRLSITSFIPSMEDSRSVRTRVKFSNVPESANSSNG